MADTGSNDGSREIAEKYADLVFDFPWINDFSAARNAVMDRCTGKWYFSVDCDEWLKGDLNRLAVFVLKRNKFDFATINVRSFFTNDFNDSGKYSDFLGLRFVRMSTGIRYANPIHEAFQIEGDNISYCFSDVMLYHDGYLPEVWDAENKGERNLTLLEQELKKNPHSLRTHMQLIDSSNEFNQKIEYTRRALNELKLKLPGWETFGPPILRHGVGLAATRNLPELDEWLYWAEEWFPDSMFTKIDVNFYACGACWNKKDYKRCIRYGEDYLQAYKRYLVKDYDLFSSFVSSIRCAQPCLNREVLINVAGAYARIGQTNKAMEYFNCVEFGALDKDWVGKVLWHLQWIYAHTDLDTVSLICRLWDDIQIAKPKEKQAKERLNGFIRTARKSFTVDCWKEEDNDASVIRRSCLALKGIAGQHALGDAALLLTKNNPSELEEYLLSMEDWKKIPINVLGYVIKCGVRFPLPGVSISLESMHTIANNLANEAADFPAITQRAVESANEPDTLVWAQAVVSTALLKQNWDDTDAALKLCHDFIQVEQRFISFYFAESALENIVLLPPMHRFGWYCVKAFKAKGQGRLSEYVSLLRKGLQSAPEMKKMVGFLLESMKKEQQQIKASSELVGLAEKVKAILSQYPSDDPALESLKNSPVYQKVAWLIEEKAQSCNAPVN